MYGPDISEQVLEAKTPSAMLGVEGEDARKDSRMIRDDRVQEKQRQVRIVLLLHSDALRRFLAFTGRNDFRKADVTVFWPAECSEDEHRFIVHYFRGISIFWCLADNASLTSTVWT